MSDCKTTVPGELGITHLAEIKIALKDSNYTGADWIDLGLDLGLLITTLKPIETEHKGDVYRCLLECLTKWLQKADNVNPPPSWAKLASALRQIGQNAAADKIIEMTKELRDPACQILQKYSDRLSQVTVPFDVLCSEGVITQEISKEIEGLGGYLINGPLRLLRNTVYNNHQMLKKFARILLKSSHTKSLAEDILKDYDQTFSSQVTTKCTSNYGTIATGNSKRESDASSLSEKMASAEIHVLQGKIVHSLDEKKITILHDTVIGFNKTTGKILFVEDANNISKLQSLYNFTSQDICKLSKSQFLIPGFVDTYIHAPQYCFAGTGYDMQLLDWLNAYTFPTEAKFKDIEMAREMYHDVVRRTLNNGTTTASYFATIHLEPTKELCRIIDRFGQRALVGKASMDINSPSFYIEKSTKDSVCDTKAFIDFVEEELKNPLIQPVISPRFSPSCSIELMEQLAQIANEKNLRVQSHMCEQRSEIEYTLKKCHPGYSSCAEIFDKVGLLSERTYMAHCVHMSEVDVDIMKKCNVGIAHCPSSNLCLKSGFMDARKALTKEKLKVGLGTDVSGGFSPSMLDAIRSTLQTSRALYITEEIEKGEKIDYEPITLDEAFYMATLGGAQVLNLDDKIGNFVVDKQFDALLIDTSVLSNGHGFSLPVFDTYPSDTFEDVLSKFVYLGDDRNIVQVFVAGRELINKLS